MILIYEEKEKEKGYNWKNGFLIGGEMIGNKR